ncbi:MAG: GatB/YqeY domain-containing protein [Betaproteobacteria bacterium]|nr:GatB/YqeY domain-containing protein [Betaproteobacteria bacterium]
MSLKERITEDMKNAMRAKDAPRLSAVRLLLAAIKQREVDERIALDDAQVIAVLEKMIKQRRDSIAQFAPAGRDDLVSKEQFEIDVLSAYLPQPLTEAEVAQFIAEAVAAAGATGLKDMGAVMAILKPKLAGRADMGRVSAAVKDRLAGR